MNYFKITFLSSSRTPKRSFSLGIWLKIFCVFFTTVRIALIPPLMPIVTKGGVVHKFYVDESDTGFGYFKIFPSGLWP
jgi:hypothetical protein